MSRHEESLDGGVVSSKDAALLSEGELAAARNAHYFPGTPALTRARGRTTFGTVSATAVDVVGLRDVQFDNGTHLLVAHASASYLTAVVGDTGTFGYLTAAAASALPGIGTQLERVQYRNRFFLFNGYNADASSIGSNRVVYLTATAAAASATIRQHGMLPVVDGPTITTAGGGSFSQSATGYYEYWTTEVARFQQDNVEQLLESTFVGEAVTVFISATGVQPTVQMPAVRNPITTHWRIYRSPLKASSSVIDRKFPAGFMISDVATGLASAVDTASASNTGQILPGNENGVGDGATFYTGFSNASALASADSVFASADNSAAVLPTVKAQGVYGFNFGGFTGAVRGVEIEMSAYISSGTGPVPVSVTIGRKRQSNGNWQTLLGFPLAQQNTVSRGIALTATASASPQTLTLGGPTDRWFSPDAPYPFTSTDFGTDFMAIVAITKPLTSVGFDYVKARVYYSAAADSTVQFPTIVYTFGDQISQVGKNGKPPDASTGDLYEDTLVTNDALNPRIVRYSFPGEPEYFPPTYYIPFETNENDTVRCIKTVNNRCLVWLDTSAWRINYLPNERDAQFDRGKAKEPISKHYGAVNPMCVCTYTPDGVSERAAFVSHQGIHDTDGYDFRTLTDDLDWNAEVAIFAGTYTPIALVNDAQRYQLLYYFKNTSLEPELCMCLPLCYAGDHLKAGKAKPGGYIHMTNYDAVSSGTAGVKSAWAVPRTNGDVGIYLGYGDSSTAAGAGTVYRENGTNIPARDSTMKFTTRRIYAAGFSNEWELNEVYGYTGSYTGSPVVTYSVNTTKTNDSGLTQAGSKSISLGGQKLHRLQFRSFGEGLQLSAVITASAYAQEKLIFDGRGFGIEDSGR